MTSRSRPIFGQPALPPTPPPPPLPAPPPLRAATEARGERARARACAQKSGWRGRGLSARKIN
eukprot:CAMPEP_0204235234 /NCGR_PEP_ID=MMETSP0361-20130328/91539_1 /ASSEMBLY_ACC=CAM_ASM_000343 /TAXON_ID=268821 /ORGANISM="Scrippsiella Hangoei, Strain SHTV-5" /LENGTH=62 /DNA_ID=CAMNT_0051206557 /DNA_START=8 /DNA_END=193 /DNA_ORIENTATION=+